jgi:hypothetical protein
MAARAFDCHRLPTSNIKSSLKMRVREAPHDNCHICQWLLLNRAPKLPVMASMAQSAIGQGRKSAMVGTHDERARFGRLFNELLTWSPR